MIIYDGSVNTYVLDYDKFCTCPAFLYRGTCKHTREVSELINFGEVAKKSRKYRSSINALNEKFNGYFYNNDGIVGIMGKASVGKSLFAIQETYSIARDTACLYIDTEGGALSMIEMWHEKMNKRFEPKHDMILEQKKSLESLHEFLGFRTNISFKSADKTGTKGKLEFRVIETIREPEINRIIEKHNIGFIVLDSVSSPIRQSFTDEQQNFPAKASATALIFGKLLELQGKYDVGVLVTLQASFNPADMYATVDSVTARGGIVVHHYTKRLFYMDRRDKREYRDYRRLWFLRAETTPRFNDVVPMFIDDNGFHDTEKTPDELLTDSEIKVLYLGEDENEQ